MAEEYGMTEALGMVECKSYPAMVEAADAMVKGCQSRIGLVREDRRRFCHRRRTRRRRSG